MRFHVTLSDLQIILLISIAALAGYAVGLMTCLLAIESGSRRRARAYKRAMKLARKDQR